MSQEHIDKYGKEKLAENLSKMAEDLMNRYTVPLGVETKAHVSPIPIAVTSIRPLINGSSVQMWDESLSTDYNPERFAQAMKETASQSIAGIIRRHMKRPNQRASAE